MYDEWNKITLEECNRVIDHVITMIEEICKRVNENLIRKNKNISKFSNYIYWLLLTNINFMQYFCP